MKTLIIPILFLSLFTSSFLVAQSNRITVEYSPHFSNLANAEQEEAKFKIGHLLSVKSEYPITEDISFLVRVGYNNLGYKIGGGNGTSSGGVTFLARETISNNNYAALSIGNMINFNKYFLSTEVGMGFLLSNSLKMVSRDETGEIVSTRKSVTKSNFRFSTVPFSLSIGRSFELFDVAPVFGLNGYYALSRKGGLGYYGIGCFLGYQF